MINKVHRRRDFSISTPLVDFFVVAHSTADGRTSTECQSGYVVMPKGQITRLALVLKHLEIFSPSLQTTKQGNDEHLTLQFRLNQKKKCLI